MEASAALQRDGSQIEDCRLIRSLDLRYEGQEYTLTVPIPAELPDRDAWNRVRQRFDELHQARYSHSAPNEPVEIVNSATGRDRQDQWQSARIRKPGQFRKARPMASRRVDAGYISRKVFLIVLSYDRSALIVGEAIVGPAVIEEAVSTSIAPPGHQTYLVGKRDRSSSTWQERNHDQSDHARGRAKRLDRLRRRDGDCSLSHRLQHDDL